MQDPDPAYLLVSSWIFDSVLVIKWVFSFCSCVASVAYRDPVYDVPSLIVPEQLPPLSMRFQRCNKQNSCLVILLETLDCELNEFGHHLKWRVAIPVQARQILLLKERILVYTVEENSLAVGSNRVTSDVNHR